MMREESFRMELMRCSSSLQNLLSLFMSQPGVHGIDKPTRVVQRDVMISAGDLDQIDLRTARFRVGHDCGCDAVAAAAFDQQCGYADPVPVRRNVEQHTFRIDVTV